MKIVLIRHGMTEGNKNRKYIGVTDEPLCREGIEALKKKYAGGDWREIMASPEVPGCRKVETETSNYGDFKLFVSPLLRCRETAEILFPGNQQTVIPELSEMDFGIFENRAFTGDLEFEPEYQAWLDTMCEGPVPGGESKEIFTQRCINGFQKALAQVKDKDIAAFVVHGGSIMSIMSQYGVPARAYYDWSVKNGEGYLGVWDGQHIDNVILLSSFQMDFAG